MAIFDKLKSVEERFIEIESRLSDPDIANKPAEFKKLSQEHSGLQELVSEYRDHKKILSDLESSRALFGEKDPDIAELARVECKALDEAFEKSRKKLQLLLLPKDPSDHKSILFEIRAGAGGDEAALFVGELFRLYQRYCERQGWKVDVLSVNPTGIGGFKEIIAEVSRTILVLPIFIFLPFLPVP